MSLETEITDLATTIAAEFNSRLLSATTTKTAAYTAAAGEMVICSAASASFTVTMPASPSVGAKVGVVLDIEHTSNNIDVAGDGSDTIAGGNPERYRLCIQGDSVTFVWTGSTWSVVADTIRPHSAMVYPASNVTSSSASTWITATCSSSNNDDGGLGDATGLTTRRAGKYLVQATAFSYGTVSNAHDYILQVTGCDGVYNRKRSNSSSTWVQQVEASAVCDISAAVLLRLQFYSHTANAGLDADIGRTHLAIQEIR